MQQYLNIPHCFPPVYDQNSKILILGSFPSVASRDYGFYYGHPRNRFWPLLSRLLAQPLPSSIGEKRKMLLDHGIALWDAAAVCSITGSGDASIRDAKPNDLAPILSRAQIRRIFTNGAKAHELYCRLCRPATGLDALKLPSTSPANAAWDLEQLEGQWRIILEFLK